MTGVCVVELAILRVQDRVKAGHKHAGWNIWKEQVIGLFQHLARRKILLGGGA